MLPSHQQPTVLLTLGRLPAGLEIARAFKLRGWRVLVADPMRWHLCRLSRCVDAVFRLPSPLINQSAYLAALRQLVAEQQIDLIATVLEDSFHVSELRASVVKSGAEMQQAVDQSELGIASPICSDPVQTPTLAVPPLATLYRLHDKWLFNQYAASLGLDVPSSTLAGDVIASQRLLTTGDVIVKPRLSCSGFGITELTQGADLPQSLQSNDFIVQRRLSGAACCSLSMVVSGEIVQTIVYRNQLESGSVGVMFVSIEPPAAIAGWIRRFCEQCQYSGWLAFDFIEEGGVWYAIECNPRVTSGVHFMQASTIVDGLIAVGASNSITHAASTQFATPSMTMASAQTSSRQTGQLFWSALMAVYSRLFHRKPVKSALRSMLSFPDVTFSWRDPLPCLVMPVAMWPTLWRAIRQRRPVEQVLLEDIHWQPNLALLRKFSTASGCDTPADRSKTP